MSLSITVSKEDEPTNPKFKEETKTLIVNAHGALIALSAKVVKGQTLLLKNPHTRAEQSCLVKFIGSLSGGKTQIGVEFTSASPLFWGIQFPPEDWNPPSVPTNRPSKS
jgi:hypothetical protein